MKRYLCAIVLVFSLSACNSSTVDDILGTDPEDILDIVDGIERKTIDTSRLGTNAFANEPQFGSVAQQFAEVKNTLGLKFIRVLFSWNDAVQSGPNASPNWSFYDSVAANIPAGVDALVVITEVPTWMNNPSNWIEANARTTFVEQWVRKVVRRYRGNNRIIGWQIWNEPNQPRGENSLLALMNNPANYVEMLARAHSVAKDLAPNKLVVNAATTAINQNFPGSLDYNKAMRDAGALEFLDRYAIHYYGRQYERVVQGGGVEDFLDDLGVEVWITESGRQGVNSQLRYAEETWPFLRERINMLTRIYQYQFAESGSAENSYGLKNSSQATPVSDLYIHLRDRAG